MDPHYLAWKLRSLDFNSRFIELASEVTRSMPGYVVGRVAQVLNDFEKSVRGSHILVLGVAYKPDVGDVRESPSLDIIAMLRSQGASVSYNDPHVPAIEMVGLDMQSIELDEASLGRVDCVVVATHHTAYDYPWIVRCSRCLFDTRNATKGVEDSEGKIIRL